MTPFSSSHYLQLRDTYDLIPGMPITQADFEAITHNGMGIEQGVAHVDYSLCLVWTNSS